MSNDNATEYFAVLDVETNWNNQVMSIGVVIAEAQTFKAVNGAYFILSPEYKVMGMFSSALNLVKGELTTVCARREAIEGMRALFAKYGVCHVFAYNACFDYGCLPELSGYVWHDIMRIAAYRQYNGKISVADCGPSGRLKRGYGVESIMRLLSGQPTYCETHNALIDALDELQIMLLLNRSLTDYPDYIPKRQTVRLKEKEA